MTSRVPSVQLTLFWQLISGLLISQLIALPTFSAPLYKWVDENGEIRYSDSLPANQSRKRFQTLTPSGRIITTREAAKTPEQKRNERLQRNLQAEENRIKAEVEKRLSAQQEHHDNVLLMTFTHEGEIQEAQNERLAVIDSVIKLLNKNIETEKTKLQREEKRAKELYLDKNLEIPGGQAQKIEYFTNKVLSKQQHLSLKLEERGKVKQQYIQDLIRYRELRELIKHKEIAEQAEQERLKLEKFNYQEADPANP